MPHKVVVLFIQEDCESCKRIKKTLKQLTHLQFSLVDIDKDPAEARNIKLQGVPALYNRITKKLMIGNVSPKELEDFFDPLHTSPFEFFNGTESS